MPRLALILAVLLTTLYLSACALVYGAQRQLIYYPTAAVDAPAQRLDLPGDGVTLRLWRLGPDSPHAVLYFGGNAEQVAGNIPLLSRVFADRAVYLVNYRGYGGSSGTPSEAGLVRDALAVFDWLQARHARIDVIGRSLGSGVAVQLAAQREVGRLVLVTPYDSIEALARRQFPWLPVRLLLQDRYDSVARAGQVRAPVLALLANVDTVIPRPHSARLIKALPPGRVQVRVLAGTGHNTIGDSPAYGPALAGFLDAP